MWNADNKSGVHCFFSATKSTRLISLLMLPRLPLLISILLICFLLRGPLWRSSAATLPAGFTEVLIADGILSPTAMAIAPDGRIFVCQQDGNLRVVKNGALLATPFVTIPVSSTGERGLLGVTFDPNFATNQFVYVYHTTSDAPIHNRISRFTANGDVAGAGSQTTILDLSNPGSEYHNGGALHFGPDGKLYIAVGDDSDSANSQKLTNLHGKILRINADGSIPADNPFYNQASGVNRAIWALGLRNPFMFNIQPGTGRIFINDVGADAWEEINDGIAGSNYGWPDCEGVCISPDPSFRDPIHSYDRSQGGCAITGGAFYNPATQQFPAQYVGKYFFADYCVGWIRYIDPANPESASDFATGLTFPVDLQVGAEGSLYYLQRGGSGGAGQVWRIVYTATVAPIVTQHPASQIVGLGHTTTFTVAASGATPLGYQWRKNGVNISGATSSSYTTPATTTADNGSVFTCVVSNANGTATSNSATLTVVPTQPPVATITAPAAGALYSGGEVINYSGAGTDEEDGNLPPSAFTWEVVFHHNTHTHPFIQPFSGVTSGSFTIPTVGETATNVWYRIHLTVTDSSGLKHSVFRDISPRVSTITLTSDPGGLRLTLDGQPVTTPFSTQSVAGVVRALGVITPQLWEETTYQFSSWSDGGAALHTISTPATSATYNATFAQDPDCTFTINFTNQDFTASGGTGAVSVATEPGCLWAVASNDSWITITSGASGAGSGGAQFSVAANTGPQRTGTIIVADQTFTITQANGCSLAINPTSLPGGLVGVSYNQTVTATGGTAPYSFSVSAGTLPAGLTLASGGALTGAPTGSGTFNFTITATDSIGCAGARSYTLSVSSGLMYYPLPRPIRLLETRPGELGCDAPGAPISGGTSRTQTAAGRTCDGITIPTTAKALTGNITTVQSGGGYLTLYPSDAAQPTVANSNYEPNEVLNNVFTVGLSAAGGAFNIFVTSDTHIVVDVTGYYAPPGAGGLYFHPLPRPIRLLETRSGELGCNTPGTPIPGGVDTPQQARLTCDGVTIPTSARAIVGNATTIFPGAGYLTLFPADATRPLVASSNYSDGQIMNAPFTVGLSPAGEFKIFATGATDLVIDVLGYYSPEANDVNGVGLLFTPLEHPVRLLETRDLPGLPGCYKSNAPIQGGVERTQPARGVCDGLTIASNALGIVGNATVVNSNGGYLTFWPSDATQPLVATSNFLPGQIFNRHFTVGLSAGAGAFKIFAAQTTDLVIDVTGYFAP